MLPICNNQYVKTKKMFILKILINFYHQDVADNRVEHKLYPIIAVDSLFTSKEKYHLQIYLD